MELRHASASPEFIGFVGVAYPTYLPGVLAEKLGMAIEREVHNPLLKRYVDIWRFDRQQSDPTARSVP